MTIHRGGCDHCAPTCNTDGLHYDDRGAMWDDDVCPACAERKKIVALLRAALQWLVDDQDVWLINALTDDIEANRKAGEPGLTPENVIEQIVREP